MQTLQTYGEFLYDGGSLSPRDRLYQDPKGVAKLKTFRWILEVAQRAPFQFALSKNSFIEVQHRGDTRYLQWAYEVLDHWLACFEVSGEPRVNARALAVIDSVSFNYLGAGDRALIKDALTFGCDAFLTMENKLPKVAAHIHKMLDIRVFSPIEMWEILRLWAALFC